MKLATIAVALLTIGMVSALNQTNATMNHTMMANDTNTSFDAGWLDVANDDNFNQARTLSATNTSRRVELLSAPDPQSDLEQGAQAIDYDGDGIGTIVVYFEQGSVRPATASEISRLDLN